MPVLNVADIQIAVDSVRTTQFALGIKDSTGAVYYAPASVGACADSLKVKKDGVVYTIGKSSLYHTVTSLNTCETLELRPGCYTVEVMGGRGGDGGNNAGTGKNPEPAVYTFSLDTYTTVYMLRGGDGANGSVNTSGNIASGGGGGATGAPSIFVVNGVATISNGGEGGDGAKAKDSSGATRECGSGGKGSMTAGGNGAGSVGADDWLSNGFVCGAGGGGAVGGTAGSASSGFLYNGLAGVAASSTGGGKGGDASMGGLFGSSSAPGGAGGANVAYSCGGTTAYSYGGGGGGAVATGGLFGTGKGTNGGAGGSGAVNSSSVSYIKIYRFE